MLWSKNVCVCATGFGDKGGCFTNASRALQNILSKFVYRRNRTSYENFKLKLCMCAQSHALGTHTKFRLEILTLNAISSIVDFREIILESSLNVSEIPPRITILIGTNGTAWQHLLNFYKICCPFKSFKSRCDYYMSSIIFCHSHFDQNVSFSQKCIIYRVVWF